MNYTFRMDRLRTLLLQDITHAVKSQADNISLYRHIPKINEEAKTEPFLIDIFLYSFNGVTSCLLLRLFQKRGELWSRCQIKDMTGNNVNTSINNMTLESLCKIHSWLVENKFLPVVDTQTLYCQRCGRTDVETLAYVAPNKDNEFVSYFGDDNDEADSYCNKCHKHVQLIPKVTLLEKIDHWFFTQRATRIKEFICCLKKDAFSSENDHQEFHKTCERVWNNYSDEQKIACWRKRHKPTN